jgi:uncharacterized protein (DUF433 family)
MGRARVSRGPEVRIPGTIFGDAENPSYANQNCASDLSQEATWPLSNWSQCPGVESVPGKLSGAWVFRNSRMPVKLVFENLEDGMTIDEIIEQYDVTREQVKAVIDFAARTLDTVSS